MDDAVAPTLRSLGWDTQWDRAFAACAGTAPSACLPGRVARVDRGACLVLTADGPVRATVGAAVLERLAVDVTAGPCTGDWVALRAWPDGPVTTEAVLPRRTAVARADVAGSSREQLLVANVDVVAVVVGLVPEPSLARVERLLALAWSSGATPVVVLTKSDLVPDAEQVAEDVAEAAPGVRVLVGSALTGEGVSQVRDLLTGNRTLGLLGASGVGKSSLVNALAGAAVMRTREIRADGRGRHTTARRELVPLSGGVVVDTPGLRGVGLAGAQGGLATAFAEIEWLAQGCRFRDCSHTAEPGCAVLDALDAGELAVRRVERWRKLRSETARMQARVDARLRAERRRAERRARLRAAPRRRPGDVG